jgi:hypothetical protein
MKHAVEVGSGSLMYIISFIEAGSSIQKLLVGGIHRHTDSMEICVNCKVMCYCVGISLWCGIGYFIKTSQRLMFV